MAWACGEYVFVLLHMWGPSIFVSQTFWAKTPHFLYLGLERVHNTFVLVLYRTKYRMNQSHSKGPTKLTANLCVCALLQVETFVILTPMGSVQWSNVSLPGFDSSNACGVIVTPSGLSLTWSMLGNTRLPSLLSPLLPFTTHIKVNTV